MTPEAKDFLATIAYVVGYLALGTALYAAVKVLVHRVNDDHQRDHHARTFADTWLRARDPHALTSRLEMARARQESHR